MKIISIYRNEALRRRAIILLLVLFPVLGFASNSKPSNQLSADSNQYVALQTQEVIIYEKKHSISAIEGADGVEKEEEITLEKWMLNVKDSLWHDEEMEADIKKEEWMLSPGSDFWKQNSKEEELEMENWMCNPSSWMQAL